jgi:23S rRNA pseudouridine1911/1915/1917 synthase
LCGKADFRVMPTPNTSQEDTQTARTEAAASVFPVTEHLTGMRVDRALVELLPRLSRTRAQAIIKAGNVRVGGKPVKPGALLEEGQQLEVLTHAEGDSRIARLQSDANRPGAEAIPLVLVYEDEHLLVVDKPAGLVVHPAPGHEAGTLVNALLAHVPDLDTSEDASRPGIVHRLDKDTSGLMVVAKDAPTHTALAEQMKERRMVKRYLAMVEGHMPVPEGAVDAPIGRDPRYRQRMALVPVGRGGREAVTRFRVLRQAHGRSLLDVQLETGRTHQIRVHMAAIQHPVVGDLVYGRAQPPMPPRQFLHAAHLEFAHPVTGEWMTFDAPLPSDLASFLEKWESPSL